MTLHKANRMGAGAETYRKELMRSAKRELNPYYQKLSRTSENTAYGYQGAFMALCNLTEKTPSKIISDLKSGKM